MSRISALQAEVHQTRPFRSPAEEASLSILRTAAVVRRAIIKVVEPSAGLTLAQYNVLRILRGAGPGGLPTLVVRDRLLEDAPGITRLLDKLEVAAYVRRERSTPDRRQVICYITPKGLALLKRLDLAVSAAQETGGAGLKAGEIKLLIALLAKVRAAARDVPGK
jgi:DNA-binding MarR family transcriptional regulator